MDWLDITTAPDDKKEKLISGLDDEGVRWYGFGYYSDFHKSWVCEAGREIYTPDVWAIITPPEKK